MCKDEGRGWVTIISPSGTTNNITKNKITIPMPPLGNGNAEWVSKDFKENVKAITSLSGMRFQLRTRKGVFVDLSQPWSIRKEDGPLELIFVEDEVTIISPSGTTNNITIPKPPPGNGNAEWISKDFKENVKAITSLSGMGFQLRTRKGVFVDLSQPWSIRKEDCPLKLVPDVEITQRAGFFPPKPKSKPKSIRSKSEEGEEGEEGEKEDEEDDDDDDDDDEERVKTPTRNPHRVFSLTPSSSDSLLNETPPESIEAPYPCTYDVRSVALSRSCDTGGGYFYSAEVFAQWTHKKLDQSYIFEVSRECDTLNPQLALFDYEPLGEMSTMYVSQSKVYLFIFFYFIINLLLLFFF